MVKVTLYVERCFLSVYYRNAYSDPIIKKSSPDYFAALGINIYLAPVKKELEEQEFMAIVQILSQDTRCSISLLSYEAHLL